MGFLFASFYLASLTLWEQSRCLYVFVYLWLVPHPALCDKFIDPWYVCMYVLCLYGSYKLTPLFCSLFYATPLVCTITNLVITHVSLHCTAWQLEPDSFVLRLAPPFRVLAILKHRRSVPNIIGHYRKLHGKAVNVITEESPYTCCYRNTKGN